MLAEVAGRQSLLARREDCGSARELDRDQKSAFWGVAATAAAAARPGACHSVTRAWEFQRLENEAFLPLQRRLGIKGL